MTCTSYGARNLAGAIPIAIRAFEGEGTDTWSACAAVQPVAKRRAARSVRMTKSNVPVGSLDLKAVYSPRHGVCEKGCESSQAGEVKAKIGGQVGFKACRKIGGTGSEIDQSGCGQIGSNPVRSADSGR